MPDRVPHVSSDRVDAANASRVRSVSPGDILRARAETLAQAPPATLQAADFLEVIMFRIGQEAYAIETRFVEEVIIGGAIAPIPNAAAVLLGVMNLRGEILAIMDLGLLLKSARVHRDDAWILVIGEERTEFGISVDAVSEVTNLPVGEILPPIKNDDDPLIRGVTADALTVLDGRALLEDQRLHIDDT